MAYATQADVVTTYGERLLKNVAPLTAGGVVDPDSVTAALDVASSEIDAYLSARYTVPLVTPTPFIKKLAINIAMYNMALSLGAQTDEHRRRYEDAIAYLKAAAAGTAGVGDDDTDEEEPAPGSRNVRTAFLFRA